MLRGAVAKLQSPRLTSRQASNDDASSTLLSGAQDPFVSFPADEYLPVPSVSHSMLASLLPTESAVFTQCLFSRPMFPVKILRDVAKHYGFDMIDEQFLALAKILAHERQRKGIMHVLRLAYTLAASRSDARLIVDKFIDARGTFGQRSIGAPVAPHARTPPYSQLSVPAVTPAVMQASIHALKDKESSASTATPSRIAPHVPLHHWSPATTVGADMEPDTWKASHANKYF